MNRTLLKTTAAVAVATLAAAGCSDDGAKPANVSNDKTDPWQTIKHYAEASPLTTNKLQEMLPGIRFVGPDESSRSDSNNPPALAKNFSVDSVSVAQTSSDPNSWKFTVFSGVQLGACATSESAKSAFPNLISLGNSVSHGPRQPMYSSQAGSVNIFVAFDENDCLTTFRIDRS